MPSVLDLIVHARTPEGELFQGRCSDLDSSQDEVLASVEFPSTHAPLLEIGDRTLLLFGGGGLATGAKALTVLRTDDSVRRCFCFRAKLARAWLLSLVNRRRSARLRPLEDRPVRIRILDLGEAPQEVLLHDISATGLSLLVDRTLERKLYTRIQLRLAVHLPEEQQPIELLVAIRQRRLIGSAILYGLEIDGQLPAFMQAEGRFLLFVAGLRDQGQRQD